MITRRDFLKMAGAASVVGALKPDFVMAEAMNNLSGTNKLPRWRGFNLLDFFSPVKRGANDLSPSLTTENDFKWMADWGFDFVRIPMAYPSYLQFDPKGDPGKRITKDEVLLFDEAAIERVDKLITKANQHGLHVSLNLHRAPGFCINAGFHEPYNLWRDDEAQEALYAHWEMWAKRYKGISSKLLSFDLLNEPCAPVDMNDQYTQKPPVDGAIYKQVAEGCLRVIKEQNKSRLVIADGNGGGSLVVPELTDLPLAQSCRGYYPHYISHYRASWVWKNLDDSPAVEWPGVINGETFNREVLQTFYKPWLDLVKSGVGVHCGECGCFRETPHDVFLRWFEDQLSIFTEHQIGYALWNFRGDFGVLDSKRKDVKYKEWYGHQLDEKMLQLLQKY
ncbi:MAG: cellulase family glycosylhydrolase [Parabacteroides sp.]|nr:cellulase family glycosylhydrolase [Parabacteroides sp.]